MSQDWVADLYEQSHDADADLKNIEKMFATVKSAFSGTSAPSDPVPGQVWFDSAKKLMKVRDQGDTAWFGVLAGNSNLKVWLYLNAAAEGWVVDSSITDKVLAVKGGSVYTAGADDTQGSWTQPDHTLVVSEMPDHDHDGATGSDGDHTHTLYKFTAGGDSSGQLSDGGGDTAQWVSGRISTASAHTHTITSEGGDGAHNHGSAYRPAAAVGTLQYPDI